MEIVDRDDCFFLKVGYGDKGGESWRIVKVDDVFKILHIANDGFGSFKKEFLWCVFNCVEDAKKHIMNIQEKV